MRIVATACAIAAATALALPASAAVTVAPIDGRPTVPAGSDWQLNLANSFAQCQTDRDMAGRGFVPMHRTACELFTNGQWGFYSTVAANSPWNENAGFATRSDCQRALDLDARGFVPMQFTKCQAYGVNDWRYFSAVK